MAIFTYNNGKYIGVEIDYILPDGTKEKRLKYTDRDGNPVPANVYLKKDKLTNSFGIICCDTSCDDNAWITTSGLCWGLQTGGSWLLP